MSEAPTQVAPGVHRLGNALVNCYLIEDGNRMTLVDGGLPGFRPQLDAYLRSRGRSARRHRRGDPHARAFRPRRDGRARCASDAPATVYVHEADEQMARTGKVHPRDGSMLPYLRRPAVWKLFYVGAPQRRHADAEGRPS